MFFFICPLSKKSASHNALTRSRWTFDRKIKCWRTDFIACSHLCYHSNQVISTNNFNENKIRPVWRRTVPLQTGQGIRQFRVQCCTETEDSAHSLSLLPTSRGRLRVWIAPCQQHILPTFWKKLYQSFSATQLSLCSFLLTPRNQNLQGFSMASFRI